MGLLGALGPAGACVDPAPPAERASFRLGHLSQEHFPNGFAIEDLPWDPLEEGDRVDMIFGGQGATMMALPVRGEGFSIPGMDMPQWPVLEASLDVDGHNTGFGGHFWRIANYPVWFEDDGDGGWEFYFLTVLIDEPDLSTLVGQPAHFHGTLEAEDVEPMAFDVDFEVGRAPE
jgi:hypothetical protein